MPLLSPPCAGWSHLADDELNIFPYQVRVIATSGASWLVASLVSHAVWRDTNTERVRGELGMRIFMHEGLVGCSMREGVCARAYIQRRALTASRRSMDTSIFTRSLSARLRRGRSRTRRRRYRCSRRSRSRRLLDDGEAPTGEDVDQRHAVPTFVQPTFGLIKRAA